MLSSRDIQRSNSASSVDQREEIVAFTTGLRVVLGQ